MPSYREYRFARSLHDIGKATYWPAPWLLLLFFWAVWLWMRAGSCDGGETLARIWAAVTKVRRGELALGAVFFVGMALLLFRFLWPAFEMPWSGLGEDVDTAGPFESAALILLSAVSAFLLLVMLVLTFSSLLDAPPKACPDKPRPDDAVLGDIKKQLQELTEQVRNWLDKTSAGGGPQIVDALNRIDIELRLLTPSIPEVSPRINNSLDRVADEMGRLTDALPKSLDSVGQRLDKLSKSRFEVALDKESLSPLLQIASAIPEGAAKIDKRLSELPKQWSPPSSLSQIEAKLGELTEAIKGQTHLNVEISTGKLEGKLETLIEAIKGSGSGATSTTKIETKLAELTETLKALGPFPAPVSLGKIEGKLDDVIRAMKSPSPTPPINIDGKLDDVIAALRNLSTTSTNKIETKLEELTAALKALGPFPAPVWLGKIEGKLDELTEALKSQSATSTTRIETKLEQLVAALQGLETVGGMSLSIHFDALREELRALAQDAAREASASASGATSLAEIDGKLDRWVARAPSEPASLATLICVAPSRDALSTPRMPPSFHKAGGRVCRPLSSRAPCRRPRAGGRGRGGERLWRLAMRPGRT